jgi:hypothetical protein
MAEFGWSEDNVGKVITESTEKQRALSDQSADVIHVWSGEIHVIYNHVGCIVIDVKKRHTKAEAKSQGRKRLLPPRKCRLYESDVPELDRILKGEVLCYEVTDRRAATNKVQRMRADARKRGRQLRSRCQNGILYLSI